MKFEITVKSTFSASHQLRLYDGSLEALHGHNWTVVVTVGAEQLDSIGVVMDFHVLERRIGEILKPFQDRHLNQVEPFINCNPSAENVALHIARNLKLPERVSLLAVEAWEMPENRARVNVAAG
jgi:6-pyruvoyltetrahydropterin/6-carboxytetrahydropterin synthase